MKKSIIDFNLFKLITYYFSKSIINNKEIMASQ